MEPLDDNTGNTCPNCGQPLPADTPLGGLCPACLIKSGFYSGTAPEPAPASAESRHRFIAPPVEELQPHFPHLEIIELIGRGGMGAVYKARQPKLNRLVALKILARDPETDARFADRFQREAQALAHMNHPNIVTVYDFGEAGGHYYLLMEHVDGLNLRQIEQGKKLTPEEALAIVPPICEALQYAHSQGIVHRDIKPENILLDKDGRVKIADFGIAKILGTATSPEEPLTGEEQRVGTPHYMAPEQVEKPTTVDHRADIYSLGVVFYEMLTGELPLGRFAPPSKKVQVDVRIDEIVLRALEKEPELRFQQVSEIRTQVETLTTSQSDRISTNEIISNNTDKSNYLLIAGLSVASLSFAIAAFAFAEQKQGISFFLALVATCGFAIAALKRWHSISDQVPANLPAGSMRPQRLEHMSAAQKFLLFLGYSVFLGTTLVLFDSAFDRYGIVFFFIVLFSSLIFLSSYLIKRSPNHAHQAEGPPPANVKAPAIGLIITGAIAILPVFLLIPFIFLVQAAKSNAGGDAVVFAAWPFIGAFLLANMGAFVLFGGSRMLQRRSYGLCVAAAIVAIFTPPIGLPFGIWALIALSGRGVEDSFSGAPVKPVRKGSSTPGSGAIAVALAACWFYAVLLFGIALDFTSINVPLLGFLAGSVIFVLPSLYILSCGLARRWQNPTSSGRDWFKAFGTLSFILSLAVIPAGGFAFYSVVFEELPTRSGWNPRPEEALISGFAWLGMFLLPWSVYVLLRAGSSTGRAEDKRAGESGWRTVAAVVALVLIGVALAAPLGVLERLILVGIALFLIAQSGRPNSAANTTGPSSASISGHIDPALSRYSRTAIAGAVWAALLPLSILVTAAAVMQTSPDDDGQLMLISLIGTIGKSALIGTTVLGIIAITHIRNSGGRLRGHGLAVFDAVLFPLIAIATGAYWIINKGMQAYLQHYARPGHQPDDFFREFREEVVIVLAVLIFWEVSRRIVRFAMLKAYGSELVSGQDSSSRYAITTFPAGSATYVLVAIYGFAAFWAICSFVFNLNEFSRSGSPERALAGALWIMIGIAAAIGMLWQLRRYQSSRGSLATTASIFAAGAVALWLAKPHARDTIVTGTVLDATSNQPVAAAIVTLETPDMDLPPIAKSVTDSAGRYTVVYTDRSYPILNGRQVARTADSLIQVRANGYETAGRLMSMVQFDGADFVLRPKVNQPEPVTTADGAVTLASAHLHTPGDYWTINLNVHNNTTSTQYVGIQTTAHQAAAVGGGTVMEPEVFTLEPGMSNFTQHLNYSILRKRPLDVTVDVARLKSPSLSAESGQKFLPADAEYLLQKTMKLVVPGDVNETLNAAAIAAASPEQGDSPAPLQLTFSSGISATLLGIANHPRNGNAWNVHGDAVTSVPEGFAMSEDYATARSGQIARQFYLQLEHLPGNQDVAGDIKLDQSIGRSWHGTHKGSTKLYAIAATFPDDVKETALSVGIATDDWSTLIEAPFDEASGFSGQERSIERSFDVTASGLLERDGKFQVILTDDMPEKQIRLTLLDSNGDSYISTGSSSRDGSDNYRQSTFFFDRLTSATDITSIRVETRGYEWRRFENVPLHPKPGSRTTSEETSTAPAAIVLLSL